MLTSRKATVTYIHTRERILGVTDDEIPSGDRLWPVDAEGRRIDYAAVYEQAVEG